jgi:hypothetical protein
MTDDALSNFIAESSLVSIKRESIDQRSLQAFPIAFSSALLCVRYVHDFYLDGYLFLRRIDISSIECRATDRFQCSLLDDAGLLPAKNTTDEFPLDSFTSVLSSIKNTEIAIVECECSDDGMFAIGRHAGCDADDFLAIHEFSTAGNWDGDLTKFAIEDVTCVQLRTNYILHYQRYFDRIGLDSARFRGWIVSFWRFHVD